MSEYAGQQSSASICIHGAGGSAEHGERRGVGDGPNRRRRRPACLGDRPAGEDPQVVLEATYGWYWAIHALQSRGHLFPTVPILLELQRRGHDVVIRTLGAEVPGLRGLRLKADSVSPEIEALGMDDYVARSAQAGLKRAVLVLTRRAAIEVPEVRDLIAEERPDVVLVDGNTWGAAAVAEASGLPWAMVQDFPTPLPSCDVPPFGPGLRPMGGRLGRIRNRVLRPIVLGVLERTFLPPLNRKVRPRAARPRSATRTTSTAAPR